MLKRLSCALFFTLCWKDVRAAEPQNTNLCRLSTASIYANRSQKELQNLFDGKTASVWTSTANDPWVRVTFAKPVTIQSIVIHAADEGKAPRYYGLHLRHPDHKEFLTYPLVKTQIPTSKYDLPHPVSNVDEVWLTFLGQAPVQVAEIEILGEPAPGTDLTESIPQIDPTGPAFVKELQGIERRQMRRDFEKF